MNYRDFKDKLFILVLGTCVVFQATKIYSYTVFADFEVENSTPNANEFIKIYTSNVLQSNPDVQSVINDAKRFEADLLLFTETNIEWVETLSNEFKRSYPFNISVPQENTYGMLLLSKLELVEEKVRYLIEDTIPSIDAKFLTKSGKHVQLFAIHPAPPTPHHNPSSVDRDAELMKIAQLSRSSSIPVIAIGDFNDVAWSESTELFQEFSGLLDLRKGRGFYNTYSAKSYIIKWPLDHIFTSSDFRVKRVELGGYVGSDHFPFFTELSFEPHLSKEQQLPEPSKDEIKEGLKQIEKEKRQ